MQTVVLDVPASASCVRISPDIDNTFHDDDDLPDGRTMGNFILLPTGKIFLVNGVNQGVAGYGNDVRIGVTMTLALSDPTFWYSPGPTDSLMPPAPSFSL